MSRPHNELERRVSELNKDITSLLAQLIISSSGSPAPIHHNSHQNPYPSVYPNPPVVPYQGPPPLIDPELLDKVAPLDHWEKKLPKEERELKVNKWIQDVLRALPSCSRLGELQHRDPSPATGDTKPQWQVEADLAESEDHNSENGDKVAASDPEFNNPLSHKMSKATIHTPKILTDGIVNPAICSDLFEMSVLAFLFNSGIG